MTFSTFLASITAIITSIFSWLSTIFIALYNNFVFKIILGIAIFVFLITLIIKIVNLTTNKKIEIDENIESDDDFWEEL